MSGLDLRDPKALQKRDRIFVDIYEHDSNLDDRESGLVARVVVDGWDKLTATKNGDELFNLKTDPDDRKNIAAQNPGKVAKLSQLIDEWLKDTPIYSAK